MNSLGAILLGLVLALIPPGRAQSRDARPRDSVRLAMPDSLSGGSRTRVAAAPRFPTRTSVSPSPARLGEQLLLRASVLVPEGAKVKFEIPAGGGDFTWGAPRPSRRPLGYVDRGGLGYGRADSFAVEIPLQVFTTGSVSVPGPGLQIDLLGKGGPRLRARTPTVKLLVLPTVTAADSAQGLKPVRGPLGAPWWERVPWARVALVLFSIAALGFVFWWWRKSRRRAAPAPPVRAPAAPRRDPAAEGLAELERLRALDLPGQGRFDEHAVALTRILRRYLEATLGTPRPGDTSTELLARLGGGVLEPSDVLRLELLLSLWDRVKFARAPLDRSEALRCESAVEALLRRGTVKREVA